MPDWGKIPVLFSRDALHPGALARADELARAHPTQTWCVALSGGADSLALLLEVVALWPARKERWVALHFNHRLRGSESEGDAVFCEEVCRKLGVELRVGVWADARTDASEAEARKARLDFFSREMNAAGAKVLWTGHQKEDVAETLLMRIARGSGAAGLAAPRPVQTLEDGRIFLRPLLTLTKAEITDALRKARVEWREDASNAQGDFFRNRVRLEVLPSWRAAAENDALSGAALTRELLDEDDVALSTWLAGLIPESEYGGDVVDLRALRGKPRALLRRALRRWRPAASLSRAGFEELIQLYEQNSGRMSAGGGVIDVESGVLRFSANWEPGAKAEWTARLIAGTMLFLPDGGMLIMRPVEFTADLRTRILSGGVDPSREVFLSEMQSAFQVRPWKTGDRYRPLGAAGTAKLQDLFVNRKIPAARRGQLPVVIGHDGAIRWIPGFPPAEESKLTDDSVTGVHLTYETGTYTVRP